MISTMEDSEGLPLSGASSSSIKQTAGSRVPSMFEPSRGRTRLQETGSVSDRESIATTIFSSQSKGGKRSKRRAFVEREREKISRKPLNGKLTRPSEEREWLSKNCMKVRLKLRQETGERRSSEMALYETNRELESQRLELYQANQWVDQAQREKIN